MKAEHVPIVVREPQFPEKVPKRIAEQTGATMITLPIMPGGVPQYGNVHQDDGLHCSHNGHCRASEEINIRRDAVRPHFSGGHT